MMPREVLRQDDLLAGDLLEVGQVEAYAPGLPLRWTGPFAVRLAEGHAVVVLDRREGTSGVEYRVSYAQIRRRMFGPALPEWLVREREIGPFNSGDRVVTPRGAGAVVYRRMRNCGCAAFSGHDCFGQVAAYSVKLDGVNHTGVIYGPEQLSAEVPS